MNVIDLIQGSDAWIAHREKHLNASDIPAVMGLSSYKTRNQLLTEKKTGVTPDIDSHTQRIFDNGHKYESMARVIIDDEMDCELFPVTATLNVDGLDLSASLDGVDFEETFLFEHKTLNSKLAEVKSINDLDKQYIVQMQQQCTVSGVKKCLFVASNGTKDGMIKLWYEHNEALENEIISHWKQFEIDLKDFTVEELEVKHETTELMALPSLSIAINGEVSNSNLGVYESTAIGVINSINTELLLDEQFAQAEIDIKFCSSAEKELISVKKQALASTVEIDTLFKTIDHLSEKLKSKRLTLTKLVKTQKEQIKKDIIAEANLAMGEHIISLHGSLSGLKVPVIDIDFPGVIKGKRNLVSMRDAVNTELARAKIETNKLADIIRANLKIVEVMHDHKFLFNDLQEICSKDPESFVAIVESRINKYHEDEEIKAEAMREQIRKEEEAKAELEANRKLEEEREALRREAQQRANEAEAAIAKTKKANLEKQIQEERDREKERIKEQDAKQVEKKKLEETIPPAPLPEVEVVGMITITKQEYDSLVSDSRFLQALFSAGVDNWPGYMDAQDLID